jgi:hypothetical protein
MFLAKCAKCLSYSNDFNQGRHGIESPDMKSVDGDDDDDDIKCNYTCPEQINAGRSPFSVWTRLHRLGGFYSDTMLRVECWDLIKAEQCCNRIRKGLKRLPGGKIVYLIFHIFRVRSLGVSQKYQPERLGTYSLIKYHHGRMVYQKDDGDRAQYVYYHDWGPNSGANWMIGLGEGSNSRGVESFNVENVAKGMKFMNICVTDAAKAGPFRVSERARNYPLHELASDVFPLLRKRKLASHPSPAWTLTRQQATLVELKNGHYHRQQCGWWKKTIRWRRRRRRKARTREQRSTKHPNDTLSPGKVTERERERPCHLRGFKVA